MVLARKYIVKKYFKGLPKRDDFEVVSNELPPLQDGEVLIKAEWISVDPYLRGFNSALSLPYDQFSYQVGIVEESKSAKYPVGTRVVTHRGWADYSILSENEPGTFINVPMYQLPDMQGLSSSHGVGAVGMPGATAYFGLLEICQPKAGETVVVTGAAGAVGSLVGQIAKIKGCRVIGFAGSDEKVKWLEDELGFDRAFNYKKVKAIDALTEAAPDNVDCFFDNVGGDSFFEILTKMNHTGRIALCGSISNYNDEVVLKPIQVPDIKFMIMAKQLKVQGFMVSQWNDQWSEAFAAIIGWIKSGQLKANEHVTEGFENIFDAFIGMMTGENFGKAVVKVC